MHGSSKLNPNNIFYSPSTLKYCFNSLNTFYSCLSSLSFRHLSLLILPHWASLASLSRASLSNSRRATGWIVARGRSPPCLPSLGGSWLWVARFCGGFGCADWSRTWFLWVYGGGSKVGFAMDWLWVGGWVGLSGGDGGGAVRGCGLKRGKRGKKTEIKMNSEKKNNK